MPSPILPISNHPSSSASAATTVVKAKIDADPLATILISSKFDPEKAIPITPVLPRASSFNSTSNVNNNIVSFANNHQQRFLRTSSDSSLALLADETPRQSISREVGHVAAETFYLSGLCLKLLSYLGVGYRWITRFLALGCYAMLLMPGFIQVAFYYFFSRQVRRSIIYGEKPRNRLDLYLPKTSQGTKPVVAFITGGAWIIGYKAWGSLLGQQLSERDIIVACIDYRNFPQGTISDMVEDASQGISFICNNISEYGGDPNRIYLMGQSAGAHIAACTLVNQAIKETGEGDSVSWSVSQIKAYLGLSGGALSYSRFIPFDIFKDSNVKPAVSLLPPVILFHGTADYSIPADASQNFADTLRRVGGKAESILYDGKTHTDLFLQDPMRGGRDEMFEDVVAIIHGEDEAALAKDAVAPPRRRLVPEFMLKLAHDVSPF
ncbi:putative isoprenylcysteine alpha-carbonyl methylesterase ICMEL1 isoform X1 [Gossypium australe]|uniref:protein-S-isoprenylcysteine alpha-carbonyl methylesterase n=1 Tax=Gossypium australe TaxID=47621 RepID=A0A5B6X227_9ROSI|nr:putative isoprenylcysteine alpha-carbonyl methylesterase ICMEL1 isoform X1 [Gossypium australe]